MSGEGLPNRLDQTEEDGPKCQTCLYSSGERRWWPCNKCKHSPRQPNPPHTEDHWEELHYA